MTDDDRLARIRELQRESQWQSIHPDALIITFLLRLLDERDAKLSYYETEYQDVAGITQLQAHLDFAKAKIVELEKVIESARYSALEEARRS